MQAYCAFLAASLHALAAIGDVGAILSAHFPRSANDVNELPDRVIEL